MTSLVQLCHNRGAHLLQLFLLMFKLLLFCCLVLVQSINDFLTLVNYRLPSALADLVLHLVILHCRPHVVRIALKTVLSSDTLTLGNVLRFVPLSLIHHSLDVVSTQTTLVIRDGNLVLLACALVDSRYIEDAIELNDKHHLNLRNTTRCRRNSSQLKLA